MLYAPAVLTPEEGDPCTDSMDVCMGPQDAEVVAKRKILTPVGN